MSKKEFVVCLVCRSLINVPDMFKNGNVVCETGKVRLQCQNPKCKGYGTYKVPKPVPGEKYDDLGPKKPEA